jgi:hypothetical protein
VFPQAGVSVCGCVCVWVYPLVCVLKCSVCLVPSAHCLMPADRINLFAGGGGEGSQQALVSA